MEKIMWKHMKERLSENNNFFLDPPLPRSLNIELNNTCNQKCVFCDYHGKYAPHCIKPTSINIDVVKKLLDAARKLGIGEKEVGFYIAGEAFLYPHLEEVIRYAKNLGFPYVFLTTNGAMATPDKMAAVLDAGLDSIRISINAIDKDTYKEIHGSDDFDKVVKNLSFMHEYIVKNTLNVTTSISCVLTKKTQGIQSEFRRMFEKYVDDILFIPVILDYLKADEKFIQEYEIIDVKNTPFKEKYICPLLFNSMYINANLEVFPCCQVAYNDEGFSFYDLKEDMNLENAWYSKVFKEYRKYFINQEDLTNTICRDCILRRYNTDRFTME